VLKSLTILRDRVPDTRNYPFSVPTISALTELKFHSRIVFFAAKTAAANPRCSKRSPPHYGFGREGGNRNFNFTTTNSNSSVDPLVRALRLSFDVRTGKGFFLRAESFSMWPHTPTKSAQQLHTEARAFTPVHSVRLFLEVIQEKCRAAGLFLA